MLRDTTEIFIKKAKKIHGNRYDYSKVKYTLSCIKVEIICNTCKNTFFQKANNHLNGQGCPYCKNMATSERCKKTKEAFIKEAINIFGNKYDYSYVIYNGAKEKVKIFCNTCKRFFYKAPDKHVCTKQGCPYCSIKEVHSKQLKTTEQFINDAKKIHGKDYDYSGVVYKGREVKIKITCNTCHNSFEMTPAQHLRGQGCKHCNNLISKGERKIAKWLKNNKIYYIAQKKFDDCKYKKSLPFDFYLPDYNMCIEFQGQQHYKECTRFDKTPDAFKRRQQRDQIKKDYCARKNIKLLEIRYNENIEAKLVKCIFNK